METAVVWMNSSVEPSNFISQHFGPRRKLQGAGRIMTGRNLEFRHAILDMNLKIRNRI